MSGAVRIRRALISVSDKQGVLDLAKALGQWNVEILSTGGTAKLLGEQGIPVRLVSDYTGAPEILDGRVKTLHPKIHGGLLGRPIPEHEQQMKAHGIEPIDLVCVNLYPFEQTVARPQVTWEEAIENIDIGGPAMIRSAAKNQERVAVLVDPADYGRVMEELGRSSGVLSQATRKDLAQKAFAHTAAYDAAIARYLAGDSFPELLTLAFRRRQALRYGENPHQEAAFYVESSFPPAEPTVAHADVLQGKELSFNNLLDLDAALALVSEFQAPACAIIKHTNPCGVAENGAGCAQAFLDAKACDPVSAFGGIVAVNREVDGTLARELTELFLEAVVAPSYSEEARTLLGKKKQLRLLCHRAAPGGPSPGGLEMRSVSGGLLVQTRDRSTVSAGEGVVRSGRAPTGDELAALDFAWRVCKHVKSNAIVIARVGQTVGIGAGQMSRVDSVKLAAARALLPTRGCVLASDAFFPFRDGIDEAAKAEVTGIICPGGSVRDEEVIAAANEHQMALVFTGMRHFRH